MRSVDHVHWKSVDGKLNSIGNTDIQTCILKKGGILLIRTNVFLILFCFLLSYISYFLTVQIDSDTVSDNALTQANGVACFVRNPV